MPLAECLVHAQQVADEECGFGTANAGAEFEQAREVREWMGRGEGGFESDGQRVEMSGCWGELVEGEGSEVGVGGWVREEALELGEGLRNTWLV